MGGAVSGGQQCAAGIIRRQGPARAYYQQGAAPHGPHSQGLQGMHLPANPGPPPPLLQPCHTASHPSHSLPCQLIVLLSYVSCCPLTGCHLRRPFDLVSKSQMMGSQCTYCTAHLVNAACLHAGIRNAMIMCALAGHGTGKERDPDRHEHPASQCSFCDGVRRWQPGERGRRQQWQQRWQQHKCHSFSAVGDGTGAGQACASCGIQAAASGWQGQYCYQVQSWGQARGTPCGMTLALFCRHDWTDTSQCASCKPHLLWCPSSVPSFVSA